MHLLFRPYVNFFLNYRHVIMKVAIPKCHSSIFTFQYSAKLGLSAFLLFIFIIIIFGGMQNLQQQTNRIPNISDLQNISYYLKRAKYHGKTTCKKSSDVVIGVISSPSNFEERSAIRNTWGKQIPSNWCLFFFIGRPRFKKIQSEVKGDMQIENDIVQSNVADSYYNLSIKVGLVFNWVLNNFIQAKYFLKVDDDVYLNIKKMKQLIENCIGNHNKSKLNCQMNIIPWSHYKTLSGNSISYVAIGYVYRGAKPDRKHSSKWYLDINIYPNSTLPNFLSGTSYLLTTNLLRDIIHEATKIPLINLEDLYYTGIIMTSKMKLSLQHHNKWSNFRPIFDDPCYFHSLLTAHGLGPNELIEINDSLNNLQKENCNHTSRQIYMLINEYLSYYFPRI